MRTQPYTMTLTSNKRINTGPHKRMKSGLFVKLQQTKKTTSSAPVPRNGEDLWHASKAREDFIYVTHKSRHFYSFPKQIHSKLFYVIEASADLLILVLFNSIINVCLGTTHSADLSKKIIDILVGGVGRK